MFRETSDMAVNIMSALVRVCVLSLCLFSGLQQVLAQGEGKVSDICSPSIILSADLTAAG